MGMFDDPSWPGLTFNPAKGDLHTIESLAYDVKTVGDELDEMREMLVGIGRTDGIWDGEAAKKFQDKVGELPKYLQQGHESMAACSRALRGWHDELETMQRQAKNLEERAVEARKRLDQKNADVDKVNVKIEGAQFQQLTEQQAKALSEEADSASRAAQDAATDLKLLIQNGEALRKYWEEQAAKAEKAIREAAKNRPPDISIWDKITDGLKGAWDGFKNFLIDNADLFSTISAALAAAAIVVNVIPVGGQVASAILGAGSVAFAGAAMAGHWMGGAPMWKVGLDALGVIPGVGGAGKALISGGKALFTGAREAGALASGAKVMMNQIKNPMSTKMINWGLGKFGKAVDPSLITGAVKGFSTGFGIGHLISGGNEGGGSAPAVSTQPAPATGQPQPAPQVTTMPWPASGDKFHQTLAA
ncbi:putative T7SS-secreted protein [Streptomyces sp. NPDC005303]|uniref:putative T7SS-secreted protein n=1 Tax=Streptomyces sp. NPDC005303 TaxID=3155713 RepID=UPI0033A630C3